MGKITLDQMIDRLRAGGPRRLTWVIGAGFSVSAGIPLAAAIAQRVLVFHYFRISRQAPPWSQPQPLRLIWTAEDLAPFLQWVESDLKAFEECAREAREWASKQEDLQDSLDDVQALYARIFETIIPGPEATQVLLSQLIVRSPGPNLA